MNSMELSNYLEKIRYGRKMTQETFLEGIVSLRQYQRYRNGEGEIPYHKIEQFAQKLGIPTKKLLNGFEEEKNAQSKLIKNFYNAVANKDINEVKRLKTEIEQDIIIEGEKKKFYEHSLVLFDYVTGKIPKHEALRKESKIINYPQILKQQYFTDLETLILSSLLELLEGSDQKKLLRRITLIFEEENIIGDGSDFIYVLILMRLSKMHGMYKDFNQVIKLCDIAVERGKENKQYYLWEYFYYYKALAYFRLKDFRNFELNLFRCYNVLHMEGNNKKIEKFTSWIEKDFDIVFHTFIMKYMKKEIM